MGRRSQRAGDIGETIAEMTLRMKGLKLVADMPTPFKVVARKVFRNTEWVRIIYSAKVQGDIRAVVPGGRSVLAEVKAHENDRLIYSKLKYHQVDALTRHHEEGGLSLLVWITYGNVFTMLWPIPGFKPRTSIKMEDAHKWEWEGVV